MGKVKDSLDFIIIGAQKAGTTSLFEYIRSHPELCLPSRKEAPFFSHDVVRARGWADYMRKTFALADPGTKWGTVTPSYMVGGVYDGARSDERTVPLRIRERLPDVRLIAILRDPVERARSHHQMAVMTGIERRTFDQAIEQLLHPSAMKRSRELPEETNGYVAWGEYGRILGGYFDVFPREQIVVVFTDELEREPERVVSRLQDFIGVAADYVPDNIGERYRTGATRRRIKWLQPHAAQESVASSRLLRGLWHSLPERGRRHIDDGFMRTAYSLDLWNRQSRSPGNDPAAVTLQRLKEHFACDSDRLAALLNTTLPWQPQTTPA